MKNQIVKLSLKFGLILGLVNLACVLFDAFSFDLENAASMGSSLTGIITWGLLVILLPVAHYQYDRKNDNYLSFKDAILVGLIVIGVSYVIGTLTNVLSFQFILKGKLDVFYAKMNETYGTSMFNDMFTMGTIIKTSLIGLLLQIVVLFLIITVEAEWKIFTKAGQKGWAILVPIYNIIVFLNIIKKPVWWIILLIIPIVNIVFAIMMLNQLSKRFGKDSGFTLGLLFLPIIFLPLLGLSKAEYLEE
jgi:hypothetical protein